MNSELEGQPQQILIAEDSATQALLLKAILTGRGFLVITARDGQEALERLRSIRPAAVITDIQMPVMDGYELCRQIKADPALASIPVLLVTALSAPQDIIRGLECGADNFVVKPYEKNFLLSRLQTVLTNTELAKSGDEGGLEIQFSDQRYFITSNRRQILNLLLSTYETAVNTNTALRKAQDALRAAQEQLIEAEKLQSVGRLAAGVAHEVKNPLAIIEMGIEFLASQPNSETNSVIVDEVRQAVHRANDVISSLMDLSAPDASGMQTVSMDVPLDRALQAVAAELASGGVKLITDYAPNRRPCRVDAKRIEQAFRNVFSNALQAMPQGGTLTVRNYSRTLSASDVSFDAGDRSGALLRAGERAAIVEVHDTGEGIAPENVTKVFEPFFSTKPTGKGMGLGLTVAKKFVDLHGGRITVRNADDGGAVVTMIFKEL